MKRMGILGEIERYEQDLLSRIEYLEGQVEYWKSEHFKQLNQGIQHSEAMLGLVLRGALEGAFTPKDTK